MKQIIDFFKEYILPLLKVAYTICFALWVLYITVLSIIYLRAVEQQCYPDGTYLQFIEFTNSLQILIFALILLSVAFSLILGFIILGIFVIDFISENLIVSQLVKSITSKIPASIITVPESNQIWKTIRNWTIAFILICYGLAAIGVLILGGYTLFFDDPCQFID